MEALRIDLKDYRQTGEGANGVSYDCISDPSEMIKLYKPDYPMQPIFDELEVARKVYDFGVPSPEPGTIVTDGTRLGIKFRKIQGKRSFSRMFADEPARTEEYARELARWCRKLHSMECPKGLFPDAKQQFRDMLAQLDCLDGPQKDYLNRLIDETPDSTTALHGDMHFGNIVTNLPEGAPLSTTHDTMFIDLGYFAQGHPLLDLGMMTNICVFGEEEFVYHDMHIHKSQAARVYDYFLDEYFFAGDHLADKWFGPCQTIDSVKQRLLKGYLIKSILITFNLGFALPVFLDELRRQMAKEGL